MGRYRYQVEYHTQGPNPMKPNYNHGPKEPNHSKALAVVGVIVLLMIIGFLYYSAK